MFCVSRVSCHVFSWLVVLLYVPCLCLCCFVSVLLFLYVPLFNYFVLVQHVLLLCFMFVLFVSLIVFFFVSELINGFICCFVSFILFCFVLFAVPLSLSSSLYMCCCFCFCFKVLFICVFDLLPMMCSIHNCIVLTVFLFFFFHVFVACWFADCFVIFCVCFKFNTLCCYFAVSDLYVYACSVFPQCFMLCCCLWLCTAVLPSVLLFSLVGFYVLLICFNLFLLFHVSWLCCLITLCSDLCCVCCCLSCIVFFVLFCAVAFLRYCMCMLFLMFLL